MAVSKSSLHEIRLPRWLDWYISYGTAGKSKRDLRRQLTCNIIMALSVVTGIIYAVVCIIYNPELWPTSIVGLLISLQFFIVPLIFRRNETLALGFAAIFSTTAFTTQSYLTGIASGLHLYLFLTPMVILALKGSARRGFLGLWTLTGVVGMLVSIFVVPGPGLEAADDPVFQSVMMVFSVSWVALLFVGFGFVTIQRAERAEDALEAEHARSEALLNNLLPEEIAARLKAEPDETIADSLPQVAILFADIVNFTPRSAKMKPEKVVDFLNRIFSTFDALAEKHGIEKIKTIGDAYMVAAGIPIPCSDPVHRVAEMALDMLETTRALSKELLDGVEVRIGLHTGPAVAGVIGSRKLFYDVWGETVNTASRMESHGASGRIQVTEVVREELLDDYNFEPRGTVEVKGMGPVETWWLTGRSASA